MNKKLAATDRLIDQIVYHLYGVEKDEIAIVESTYEQTGAHSSGAEH